MMAVLEVIAYILMDCITVLVRVVDVLVEMVMNIALVLVTIMDVVLVCICDFLPWRR